MIVAPPDPDKIEKRFACIMATQPVGDIYVASIPHRTLIALTHFDVRRVLQEERDVERYLGIQREVNDARLKDLSSYVNFVDASFPTSIIIALDENYVTYDETRNIMTVRNWLPGDNKPSIALRQLGRVLDGQHRIAGLESYEGEQFELPVSIFIGADISDQAQIFATVNLEQTKVNKSLVYDLYELGRTRSPQKTCHNIAVALDRDPTSPFSTRIKRLGLATAGRIFEPITQATFVEGLMPTISRDPKADRDALLRGNKISKAYGDDLIKTPLRNLFVEDRDIEIAQIIYNYFRAVQATWSEAWEERGTGAVLNCTNGVRALFRFFRVAYLNVAAPGDLVTEEKFRDRIFSGIRLDSGDFTTDNFPPGTTGEARLFRILAGRESL